jgi:hypothetical protein
VDPSGKVAWVGAYPRGGVAWRCRGAVARRRFEAAVRFR